MRAKLFHSLTSLQWFVLRAVVLGLLLLLVAIPARLCGEQPTAIAGRYSNLAQEIIRAKKGAPTKPPAELPADVASTSGAAIPPPASSISVPPRTANLSERQRHTVTVLGDVTMRLGVVFRPSRLGADRPADVPASPALANLVTRPSEPAKTTIFGDSPAPLAALIEMKDPAPTREEQLYGGPSIGTPIVNRAANPPSIRQDTPHQDVQMLTWDGADNPRSAPAATQPLAFGTLVKKPSQADPFSPVVPHLPTSTERIAALKTVPVPVALAPTVLVFDRIESPPTCRVPALATVDTKQATLMLRDVDAGCAEPLKPTPNGYIATEPFTRLDTVWSPQITATEQEQWSALNNTLPLLAPQIAVAEPKLAAVPMAVPAEPPRLVLPQLSSQVDAAVPSRSARPAPLPEPIKEIEAGFSYSSHHSKPVNDDSNESGFSYSGAFR